MAAADAMSYWISAVIPNDQFVVYCFSDPGVAPSRLAADLRARAMAIDDLRVRVVEVPGDLDRPWWVSTAVDAQQVVVHSDVPDWGACLHRIAELTADQLDPTEHAWRVHLLGPLSGAPETTGPAVVMVLQVCHALGDGRRTAAIARRLLTDAPSRTRRDAAADSRSGTPLPDRLLRSALAARGATLLPWSVGSMIVHGARAFRLSRSESPRPASGVPATTLNRPADGVPTLGVVVLRREQLPAGYPVTVGILGALSTVLAECVGSAQIAVELTVAKRGTSSSRNNVSRNNFRNVGIGLHPTIADPSARMTAIADEISTAQDRADDPRYLAERAAAAATPAFLTRWGIRQFDTSIPPEQVTGVTVVSSVNRGPADLALGGGAVMFTTGFPAVSPAQGLTHGVHGIGDRIAISVTAAPGILDDVDDYLARITRAVESLAAESPAAENPAVDNPAVDNPGD